jgi:DNA repair protein RecO (recombination protein O)
VPTIKDQALCVRLWDWSETSQTVSLLARETGLIRGLAKGAKRERAPFSGGFEVLTVGEAMLIIKPEARAANAPAQAVSMHGSSTSLATITAWDLQETFPVVRRSLRAFHAAMYIADLAQHLVQERDPHPGLFDAAAEALRSLGTHPEPAVLLRFQWAALGEAGFRPELHHDVATGEPLVQDAMPMVFSPELGGLTRAQDVALRPSTSQGSSQGPSWRLRPETTSVLRRLASPSSDASDRKASAQAVDRASRLLAAYSRHVLGRELPSARACFGPL